MFFFISSATTLLKSYLDNSMSLFSDFPLVKNWVHYGFLYSY